MFLVFFIFLLSPSCFKNSILLTQAAGSLPNAAPMTLQKRRVTQWVGWEGRVTQWWLGSFAKWALAAHWSKSAALLMPRLATSPKLLDKPHRGQENTSWCCHIMPLVHDTDCFLCSKKISSSLDSTGRFSFGKSEVSKETAETAALWQRPYSASTIKHCNFPRITEASHHLLGLLGASHVSRRLMRYVAGGPIVPAGKDPTGAGSEESAARLLLAL